jgi:hypothetical protein
MKIKVIVIVLYPVRHGGKASQHVLIRMAKGFPHRSRLALWSVADDFLVSDSKFVDAGLRRHDGRMLRRHDAVSADCALPEAVISRQTLERATVER